MAKQVICLLSAGGLILYGGTHTINYTSVIDDITITHTAHNRKGFAAGAVLILKFIQNKKSIFTMKNVLEL